MTVYAKDRQGENVELLVIRTQSFIDDPAQKVEDVQFKLAAGIIGELAAANEEIIKNDVRLTVLAFATIFVVAGVERREGLFGRLLQTLREPQARDGEHPGVYELMCQTHTFVTERTNAHGTYRQRSTQV